MGEARTLVWNKEDRERLERWVEIASLAASGGNAQPWRVSASFEAGGKPCVRLFIDEDYRHNPSPMDVGGVASLMALGAFSFNLEVAAAHDGYAMTTPIITEGKSRWDAHVELRFSAGSTNPGYSIDDVRNRWTNRNLYRKTPLERPFAERLQVIANSYPALDFQIFENDRGALIAPLTKLERIRWLNTRLREGVLAEINFSPKVDALTKIPADQLGASKPDLFLLKNMIDAPWAQTLMTMGGARTIAAKTAGAGVKNSAAVFFLQAREATAASAVRLGQAFEELWVEVNRSGLSAQPLSQSLIALSYWMHSADELELDKKHVLAIEDATTQLRNVGLDFTRPVIGMRIGKSEAPRPRPPRRPKPVLLA